MQELRDAVKAIDATVSGLVAQVKEVDDKLIVMQNSINALSDKIGGAPTSEGTVGIATVDNTAVLNAISDLHAKTEEAFGDMGEAVSKLQGDVTELRSQVDDVVEAQTAPANAPTDGTAASAVSGDKPSA